MNGTPLTSELTKLSLVIKLAGANPRVLPLNNTPVAKKCIFCGSRGPFSNEHLIPEWAAKLLNLKRVNVKVKKLGESQRPWISVGSFGAKVRRVCQLAIAAG
jgi:hypothetical protein